MLDNLKRMVIFALFSYELGRQSKSKHLFPKRDACFFIIVPYRGGTTTRAVVLSIS